MLGLCDLIEINIVVLVGVGWIEVFVCLVNIEDEVMIGDYWENAIIYIVVFIGGVGTIVVVGVWGFFVDVVGVDVVDGIGVVVRTCLFGSVWWWWRCRIFCMGGVRIVCFSVFNRLGIVDVIGVGWLTIFIIGHDCVYEQEYFEMVGDEAYGLYYFILFVAIV